MKTDEVGAKAFAALGNATRLAILRLLVRAGDGGMNVTDIRESLQVPASTLTHHLETLAGAGLLKQRRAGRELVSTADFVAIRQLSGFLMKDCCAGVFRKQRAG